MEFVSVFLSTIVQSKRDNEIMQEVYNFLSTIFVFVASIIPSYLAVKLDKKYRKLAMFLALFLVVHGIYHALKTYGHEVISVAVFETASIILLIVFGLLLYNGKRKTVLKHEY